MECKILHVVDHSRSWRGNDGQLHPSHSFRLVTELNNKEITLFFTPSEYSYTGFDLIAERKVLGDPDNPVEKVRLEKKSK